MIRASQHPYADITLKQMGRTLESFYLVDNVHVNPSLPYFRLKSSFEDTEVVLPVTRGTFAMAYIQKEPDTGHHDLLRMIVDPSLVFGHADSSMIDPIGFMMMDFHDFMAQPQTTEGRTACAMSSAETTLQTGESMTIVSMYGQANATDYLSNTIAPTFSSVDFVTRKQQEARQLVADLTSAVATRSSSALFDAYVRYDLLDNIIRGGYPNTLGDTSDPRVYHTFSRIHGDPERDYNYFVVEPSFFSQGPGNYRDMNQNRRTDVLFWPTTGSFNVRMFWSFIQADGYNPLTVKSTTLIMNPGLVNDIARQAVDQRDFEALVQLLRSPIVPGELFGKLNQKGIRLKIDRTIFIDTVANASRQHFNADFSQGFWIDHWTYNLDQIKSYLTVYPDKLIHLLWDAEPLAFYMNPISVLPRSQRFALVDGVPRQIHPTTFDGEKAQAASIDPWQKTRDGQVFKLPLVSKLVHVAIVKFAAIDPYGFGVQMEAGRPGWLDALNGLPSQFGSGMPETFELLDLLGFIQKEATPVGRPIIVSDELSRLMASIWNNVKEWQGRKDDWVYWNAVSYALEEYRSATRLTFSGATVGWSSVDVSALLADLEGKLRLGVKKAIQMNHDMPPTYFAWNITEFELLWPNKDYQGNFLIYPKQMKPTVLPIFLEGAARYFKVLSSPQEKRELYEKVKAGPLYDRKLKMYKISENLDRESRNIGRVKAFPRGWLENESVWMHMSYKFYLELLRGGLYGEFWSEAKTGLCAFMDPAVYGRSPLEVSSFIVSSVFPDAKLHGTGFVARLSGATAEFLSMWFIMMAGQSPFVWKNQSLYLEFKPILPGWLFDSQGNLTFTFLGHTAVTYKNPSKVIYHCSRAHCTTLTLAPPLTRGRRDLKTILY